LTPLAIHCFVVIVRRFENQPIIVMSNRLQEAWCKLMGDVRAASAILERFLHHAQTHGITAMTYRLKDQVTISRKEANNKKIKSRSRAPSNAAPDKRTARFPGLLVLLCC
jgi:hypothetical protein